MLTSKQRALLRSMANRLPAIFQIGKGGVGDQMIRELMDALEARELIKITVLETAMLDTREACNIVCEATDAQPVQVIGNKFVIYKKSRDHKTIEL